MPLHWLLLCAGLAAAAIGFLYDRLSLRRLSYARHFTKDRLYAGERLEMVETIRNDKLLPLPWVRLESMIPSSLQFDSQSNLEISMGDVSQNHKSLFSLNGYRQIVRKHQLTCTKRGIYKVDTATLTVGDLFGVSEKVKQIPLNIELMVYPEIVQPRDIPFSNKSWIGDVTVRRWMMEDPFWKSGVRPYQAGDSLKSVHWKATARAQSLQVHQLDYTADRKLMIVVNVETDEKMWDKVTKPELVEQALSYAASLAHVSIQQGIETGFACNAYLPDTPKGQMLHIPMAAGTHHLQAMMEAMAKLRLELSLSFVTMMKEWENASNVDFLIISPIEPHEAEASFRLIRQRGNTIDVLRLHSSQQKVTSEEAASA